MLEYYILTFDSSNKSIKAERVLRKNKLKARVIPIPEELSRGCGFSVKLEGELEIAKDFLKEKNIYSRGIYKFKEDSGRKIIKIGEK
ncbi:DUF3343 domain-containing protein [Peptoniphilus sp. AGMB00490]|uniref:DUF3343 domain-containing protein n=1 Tax=Peptoniphilus faecalis TaxID=2731255 RepID=A0A848RI39_9FIRM|nr:DUF3343 domain-containing protein [Peptoniphilus faecalis]NMW85655.1 DUF3343 domain-containing protein [Peptoniphilus faecalis]